MNQTRYARHWLKSMFSLSAWMPSTAGVKIPFPYLEDVVSHIDAAAETGNRRNDCAARWDVVADILRQAPRLGADTAQVMLASHIEEAAKRIRLLRDHGQVQIAEPTLMAIAGCDLPVLRSMKSYEEGLDCSGTTRSMLERIFAGNEGEVRLHALRPEASVEALRGFHRNLRPMIRSIELPGLSRATGPQNGASPQEPRPPLF